MKNIIVKDSDFRSVQLNRGYVRADPKWIVLGVNNVCNLHCKMCDVGTKSTETNFSVNLTGTRPLDMPLGLFEELVNQCSRYYPNAKLGYAFTEPLIYRYLAESLKLCAKHELEVAITTNALNLKKKAEEICEYGVKDLFISLDGTSKVHNEIRGNSKSFEKAIEGIEVLVSRAKRPAISIFCVITEWNFENLVDFLDALSDYPLKRIGFMHTNYTPAWLAEEHNLIFGQKYRATHSNVELSDVINIDVEALWNQISLIRKMSYNFPVSFSPEICTLTELETFYRHPEVTMGKGCSDVFSNMMIKSDGSVIPAHGRCYNFKVGEFPKQALNDIWNSEKYTSFRSDLLENGGLLPGCSRCCSAFSK